MKPTEGLYESIANVLDKSTREILYLQFIHKYYPEAFKAITGQDEWFEVEKSLGGQNV